MATQTTITCPCCGTRIVVQTLAARVSQHTNDAGDEIERVHHHPDDDVEERRGYHRRAQRFVDPHDPDGGDDDFQCPNRGRLVGHH
ncbi:hypothetical protein HY480_01855 [Candidatus Uhrbacteria bacterium]|nr:hypothetical protein [Candidatus Uhrbacteria bacterium]